jgi:hypothetical protein
MEAGFSIIPPQAWGWIARPRKAQGNDGKWKTVGFNFNPKTSARTHDCLSVERLLEPQDVTPLPGYTKRSIGECVVYEIGGIGHGHEDFVHYLRIVEYKGEWFKTDYLTYNLNVKYASSFEDSTLPSFVKASIESFRIEDEDKNNKYKV